MTLFNPVPSGRLTDRYGPRGAVAGVGNLGFHTGDDLAADEGTPIVAAHNGVVTRVYWDAFANGAGAGGNMVEIRGDDGFLTRYAHMRERSPLSAGARVVGGKTVIGHVGQTGAANGDHLHFEVLAKGRFVAPWQYVTNTAPPASTTDSPEEDDMAQNAGIAYTEGGKQINAIVNTSSGYFGEYEASGGGYNNPLAAAFMTGSFAPVSKSHFEAIRRQCAEVRAGKA